MSISYSNYRNSLHDAKDEDNVEANVDDNNRDFDRFVVSALLYIQNIVQKLFIYSVVYIVKYLYLHFFFRV